LSIISPCSPVPNSSSSVSASIFSITILTVSTIALNIYGNIALASAGKSPDRIRKQPSDKTSRLRPSMSLKSILASIICVKAQVSFSVGITDAASAMLYQNTIHMVSRSLILAMGMLHCSYFVANIVNIASRKLSIFGRLPSRIHWTSLQPATMSCLKLTWKKLAAKLRVY